MNLTWRFFTSIVGLFKLLIVIILAGAGFSSATATELLQNGNFSAGLAHWRPSPGLGSWNPLTDRGVSLTPMNYQYKGILVYQNLVVPGVSGKTLALALTVERSYAYEGKVLAVQLDYALADGQVKRMTAWNPDNALIADGTNIYNANVTMPAEAVRLVRLAVSRVGEGGDFVLHAISLAGTGLASGTVPVLGGLSPSTGAYYSTTNSGQVTLRGSNFGSVTGKVYIGTCPADLVGAAVSAPLTLPVIESWNSTQIVVRVTEPMTGGKVYVLADSVESDGDFLFSVTSPHFIFTAQQPESVVLRGQKLALPFAVNFMNGFSSAGGVSMMLTMPIPTDPETPRLVRSGGFCVELDTATLPVGKHTGMAQTLEDHSYARFAAFVVDVRTTSDILFTESADQTPVTSIKVTRQGEFTYNFSRRLIDNTGGDFPENHMGPAAPLVTVTTDNPNIVQVFAGNFGSRFFAKDNGTAHLTFTSADGLSRTLTVNVELPVSPRITTAIITPGVADNSGKSTNTIFWQANDSFGWIGYEGMTSFSFDELVRDSVSKTATWTVPVPEGIAPGPYLFYAQAGPESEATSFVVLDVVNAATRGAIEGSVITVGGSEPFGHGIMGDLEWYDAATGEARGTNNIHAFGTTRYLAAYIPPGAYRVRWVSYGYSTSTQWYPKAASFAEASTLQVTAGQTVSNINFVVLSAPMLPTELTAPVPVFNGSEITFGMPTEKGLTYVLEYKDALQDDTWKVAQSLTGTGTDMVLADPAGPATRRFYRVTVIQAN